MLGIPFRERAILFCLFYSSPIKMMNERDRDLIKTLYHLLICLLGILSFSAQALFGQEDLGLFMDDFLLASYIKNKDFENNIAIPYAVKKEMAPYVISDHHPMKRQLDAIFFKVRATQDEKTFLHCGFVPLSIRLQTYVYVARHPRLPGYLVKAYLDTELREKMHKPSWKWLVRRCEGASEIRRVIQQKKIKHFTVADKWIYPLPAYPLPPQDEAHTRHFALLLVTDMDLVSPEENLQAWKELITPEHLEELYLIISRAKGASYRPDNIAYTHQGQFAFIDTEYPAEGPDYKSIQPYLSEEMRAYWKQLVKSRGKCAEKCSRNLRSFRRDLRIDAFKAFRLFENRGNLFDSSLCSFPINGEMLLNIMMGMAN
jgi:hypothetical protein